MASHPSTNYQIEVVFEALKRALKSRSITYKELGRELKMSEANIKRIFSKRSASLSTLSSICGVLGMTLFDLSSLSGSSQSIGFELSLDAELFFEKNFDAFIFFREMGAADNLTAFLKSRQDQKIVLGWLKDFEKLGLINKKRNRFEIVGRGYLSLRPNSALKKEVERRWGKWLLEKSVGGGKNHMVRVFSTGLSERNLEKLFSEIDQLIERYQQIGILDQQPGRTIAQSVGACFAIGPYRVGIFDSQSHVHTDLPKGK